MPNTEPPDTTTPPLRGRGGRPKSEPGTGRLTTVSTRVSAAELAALQAKAAQMGMKPADWLRHAALSRRLPTAPVPEVNRVQYAELARLASNMNQLVKAANREQIVVVNDQLLTKVLAEVSRLRLALLGVVD
jgi:hypothetical protein